MTDADDTVTGGHFAIVYPDAPISPGRALVRCRACKMEATLPVERLPKVAEGVKPAEDEDGARWALCAACLSAGINRASRRRRRS